MIHRAVVANVAVNIGPLSWNGVRTSSGWSAEQVRGACDIGDSRSLSSWPP